MTLSVLDLFSIGIGPSSSHTVGPMRAARMFAMELAAGEQLSRVRRLQVELFGSLGATGVGHGRDRAIFLGLEGAEPQNVEPNWIAARTGQIRREGTLRLADRHDVSFDETRDLILKPRRCYRATPTGCASRPTTTTSQRCSAGPGTASAAASSWTSVTWTPTA